jgi:hypothetical protein
LKIKAALVAAFSERLAFALNYFHYAISEIDHSDADRALAAPTSEANPTVVEIISFEECS